MKIKPAKARKTSVVTKPVKKTVRKKAPKRRAVFSSQPEAGVSLTPPRPLPPEPIVVSTPEIKKPKKKTRRIALAILCVLLIIAALLVKNTFFPGPSSPQAEGQREIKETMLAVSKLMELPPGIPSVATVKDITKLQSQPFFAKAQNGDKVLIFADAKRAILYRPTTHRIIDVSPLFSAPVNPTPTPTLAPATFVIRNGTTTNGLTRSMDKIIKEKLPASSIIARENAAQFDYKTSVKVPITKRQDAVRIAETLSLTLGQLPEGESSATADYLIILGQDAIK